MLFLLEVLYCSTFETLSDAYIIVCIYLTLVTVNVFYPAKYSRSLSLIFFFLFIMKRRDILHSHFIIHLNNLLDLCDRYFRLILWLLLRHLIFTMAHRRLRSSVSGHVRYVLLRAQRRMVCFARSVSKESFRLSMIISLLMKTY